LKISKNSEKKKTENLNPRDERIKVKLAKLETVHNINKTKQIKRLKD